MAGIADVDGLIHHHHKFGVSELGQGAPEGHGRPAGLARIGLINTQDRQFVAEGLHRQKEIDNLRDLLPQDRRIEAVQGDGQHRLLLGGAAAEGGQQDRVPAVGHAVKAHQGGGLNAAVKTHVVAERAIRQLLPRIDGAFKHQFAMGGHLQIQGFATGQPHPLAAV